MTLNGYLSNELDIKSPANILFDTFMKNMNLPPTKAKIWIENVTVLIDGVLPLEEKKLLFRIEGFQILKWYESLKAKGTNTQDVAKWQNLDGYKELEGIMTTSHVEGIDRDRATLTIRYEKISSDIEDPRLIMDTFLGYVRWIDGRVSS